MAEKFDPYQKVTDSIVEHIEMYMREQEAGIEDVQFAWEKPWVSQGLPRNAYTGRRYNGVNVLLLWMTMEENNWNYPLFLTFNQVRKISQEKRLHLVKKKWVRR